MEKVKTELSPDIIKILTTHDADIEMLKANGVELKRDINILSSKLDNFHSEVVKVLNRPVVSLASSLTVMKDVFLIVGLVVGGIVYVASASYDARMSLMEERQKMTTEKIMKLEGPRS